MTIPILPTGNNNRRYNSCIQAGFTLIEILLAVSILAFGLSKIFTVLLETSSSLMHIKNRQTANLILDAAVWDIKEFLAEHPDVVSHSEQESSGENPRFELEVDLERFSVAQDIYRLNMSISWTEGRRDIDLKRSVYIKSI
jgi:prepilin-type N-terminal cleavage/methylation domain-containing protein